jgi:thiol-disulfide isomerase/thioredoxin
MKKFLFTSLFILLIASAFAQADSISLPPYQRFPTPPPVRLLLTDSVNYFTKEDLNKKTAVLYMLFNPDCDHCKKETEDILQNIDKFKNIQIIMATFMSFHMMKDFYDRFDLSKYENIVVGQDENYFLPPFYMARNLPFLALYNKKHELLTVFEGSHGVPEILAAFDK